MRGKYTEIKLNPADSKPVMLFSCLHKICWDAGVIGREREQLINLTFIVTAKGARMTIDSSQENKTRP